MSLPTCEMGVYAITYHYVDIVCLCALRLSHYFQRVRHVSGFACCCIPNVQPHVSHTEGTQYSWNEFMLPDVCPEVCVVVSLGFDP